MCKGIIYLVQPAEHTGTNKFKIGMSKDMGLKRFNAYGSGARYLSIMETSYPLELEQIIKKEFNNKFVLFAGREYFEANEKDIKREFLRLVDEFEDSCSKIFAMCEKIKEEINCQNLSLSPVFCSIITKELQKIIIGKSNSEDDIEVPQCDNSTNITINNNVQTQINISDNDIKGSGITMSDIVSNLRNNYEASDCLKQKKINKNELGEIQFNCYKCNKVFQTESGLWKHNHNYHKKTVKNKVDEPKIYSCTYCKKNFGYYQSRWRHEQTCSKKTQNNIC